MLEVVGLTKRFGRATAIDNLSFTVGRGELVAFLGPNGAGKSTSLLCLAGLLRPDAGHIRLDGNELGAQRGSQLALIPETPEVYPLLTVWEHLVFVARSLRLPPGWERTGSDLIERLGIASERDKVGGSLSKGMRQKLLVACGVLANTPVLMLDEPMIGLDPKGQRELREILVERRSAGFSVIVSSHLLNYLDGICDRVAILDHGRMLRAGTMAELRAAHGDRSLEQIFLEATGE